MKFFDTWRRHIPPDKLNAYRSLIDEGRIRDVHVTYVRPIEETIVEYEAEDPHEMILEELKRRCSYGD